VAGAGEANPADWVALVDFHQVRKAE
jgi:hypothetical protein